ncbi:hypothetical protein [Desulfovibrio sp. X2]|uniref:hypothetical protein n=1 Tax=Desulfovibrio sp. X2 TaxID=941449 RepID=UPI00126943D2|nr:hypothetical protein [Desulfovibrio sp. X2]
MGCLTPWPFVAKNEKNNIQCKKLIPQRRRADRHKDRMPQWFFGLVHMLVKHRGRPGETSGAWLEGRCLDLSERSELKAMNLTEE